MTRFAGDIFGPDRERRDDSLIAAYTKENLREDKDLLKYVRTLPATPRTEKAINDLIDRINGVSGSRSGY
jgi:hypothetical protein